jgi:hypothetical protein
MGEKRRSKRHGRRLKVRFGEAGTTGFPYQGLTNDVSSTGLFVVSSQTPRPGTRVHLEVMMQGERPLFVEGVVARLVIVPPELRQIMKAGFGIRYLLGNEVMGELVPSLSAPRPDDPFTLTFTDDATWRAAVEKSSSGAGRSSGARSRWRATRWSSSPSTCAFSTSS